MSNDKLADLEQLAQQLDEHRAYLARRNLHAQCMAEAAAVLRSFAAEKQAGPVAEWRLVPAEPTDAMAIAGGIAWESSPAHDVIGPLGDAWAAMLAAAPSAPTSESDKEDALRHIAQIVHSGGLACLTADSATPLIRRLTLKWWDGSGSISEQQDRVYAAIDAARAKKEQP